ncbi:hypothetical protein EV383_0037 [Pseudonocardia sediminis]|uniref:Uncharacterized protein n=1 Tax=Pseudonocardia sediminis TaxID=1397368 RepID=A0A4Q7UR73_PSEST|nr:hypothetical protein EV383_0037 [Pseudonocardia sediminis]
MDRLRRGLSARWLRRYGRDFLRVVMLVVARLRSRSFVLAALRALHLDLILVDDFLAWCGARARTETPGALGEYACLEERGVSSRGGWPW